MPPPTAAWRRDDDGHRRARRPGAGAAESHPDRTHAGIGAMTFTEFLAIVSGLAIGYWLVAVFIPNANKPRKEDAEAAAERDEAPGWGRPPEKTAACHATHGVDGDTRDRTRTRLNSTPELATSFPTLHIHETVRCWAAGSPP